jgi:hypothetical protein
MELAVFVPTWFPQSAFPVATYRELILRNQDLKYIKNLLLKKASPLKRTIRIFTYIPNNKGIVVLTTERCEVLLIMGESKALDKDLVKLQTLNDLKSVEIPDNDISLNFTIEFFRISSLTGNQ